jgi:diguanylate cyclase (GGDEF)-like protein
VRIAVGIPSKARELLVFCALLIASIAVFLVDMRILSDDVTIRVPYIIIIMAAVWFVGERAGLRNKKGFSCLLEHELAVRERKGNSYTFLYFDIDNFKRENDVKGHAEGDEMLVVVGRLIGSVLRSSDLSTRLGGDESCSFMTDSDERRGLETAERIAKGFASLCERRSWGTTLSIGAFTSTRALTIDELLRAGDELMYAAIRKRKGRIGGAVVA